MHQKSGIFAGQSSPFMIIPKTSPIPDCQRLIHVCYSYHHYPDAFNYPDNQHIQLEIKQNDDQTLFTTDGVKNQAVPFISNPHQVILLRTLITLCNTLNPLPQERWITMQLYYYDDITVCFGEGFHRQPPDYQPTYFEDSANVSIKPGDSPFVADAFVIETGRLKTVKLQQF